VPGKAVEIDFSEFEEFFKRMDAAGRGDLKKEMQKFMEGIGNDFLKIVEDEIIRLNVMDYRLLLHSFQKGDMNNVWTVTENGLTLEVGTNVKYASYVNDGHWTNKKGQTMRWVPGTWNGDRFIYTPGAKTGMLLKQKWIEGKHYFDSAIRIIERIVPGLLERKMEQWLMSYLNL
jgi:hypothetical protein